MNSIDRFLCKFEDFLYNITHPFSHQTTVVPKKGESWQEAELRYRQDVLGEFRPITIK